MRLDEHQEFAAAWRLQNPRSFLADAPGVGKTAPDIVAASLSGRRLLVGCRAVARTNWKREVASWWPDLKEEDLLIQSHNTLAVNPKAVWDAKQFLAKGDAVIIGDEFHRCFPYGTLVATNRGLLPIGKIVEEGMDCHVWSFDSGGKISLKRVLSVYRNTQQSPFVKVTHEQGSFTCTADHKIWTEDGFTYAGDLHCESQLRTLRGAVPCTKTRGQDSSVLQQSMRILREQMGRGSKIRQAKEGLRLVWKIFFVRAIPKDTSLLLRILRMLPENDSPWGERESSGGDTRKAASDVRQEKPSNCRSNACQQSGPYAGGERKNTSQIEGPAISNRTWGQRSTDARTAETTFGGVAVADRSGCEDEGSERYILRSHSIRLQSGYRQRGFEDRDRSGRGEPQSQSGTDAGCAQGDDTQTSRVVRVEILESESDVVAKRMRGGDKFVYCLEVEDTHNFFADGVLVSNCRNKETRTSQVFYGPKWDGRGGLIENVDFVFPQSGTPTPTGAGDMWIHLHALRPDLITLPGASAPLTYMQYIERYTNFSHTEYGIRFWSNKKEMLPELRAVFNEFILRRTEGTIKLPPLNFESVIVDCPAAKEVLKELRELEASSSIRALAESLEAAEAAGQEFVWSAPDAHLGELRRIIGEIKAPVIGKLIAEELDENAYKKIVIFAYHHSVIEALHEQLIEFNPVVLTGKTPQKKRQEAIDDFQNDPSIRPFIGQIQACNESITLTAADQVAVVEDDWNPDTLVQAVKRCHRRGQASTVFARVFALANSLDEGVVRVRTRKAKQTEEVL